MSRPKKRHKKQAHRPPGERSSAPPDERGRPSGGRKGSTDAGKTKWYAGRGRALKAILIFAGLMGLFYGFIHAPSATSETFGPYLGIIARICGVLLNLVGHDSTVVGATITAAGFPVQIVRGCDGLEPIAAFVAAVVASPVSLWAKLPGIVIGGVCLWLINLARIISLVLIGIHFPRAFDAMHQEVWQAAFIVLAIGFWAIWVQRVTRKKECRMSNSE